MQNPPKTGNTLCIVDPPRSLEVSRSATAQARRRPTL
jgi:hypothetical protein